MYTIDKTNCVDWYRMYITNYENSERIRNACGTVEAIAKEAEHFYKFEDGRGGFVISRDNEILALHSNNKGDGNVLVWEAKQRGGTNLNCFDIPHLIKLYERHGFKEVKREPNWIDGGKDVVYMVLV